MNKLECNIIEISINNYLNKVISLNALIIRLEEVLTVINNNYILNKLIPIVDDLEIINAIILSENRSISLKEKDDVYFLINKIVIIIKII
jgi:hypothetical protein